MGYTNVALVFTGWTEDLTPQQRLALLFMAHLSNDKDSPPVYFGGWERIAEALGLDPEANPDSARKQVAKWHRGLVKAGVVVSTNAAKKGVRAEYALALEKSTTWKCVGLSRGPDGILRGVWERVPRGTGDSAQHHQNGGATRDQNGGATRDQNGAEVGTKLVVPINDSLTTQEHAQDQHHLMATKSPAAARSATESQPEAERQRQLAALSKMMEES